MTEKKHDIHFGERARINIFVTRSERDIWIRTGLITLAVAVFASVSTHIFFRYALYQPDPRDWWAAIIFSFGLSLVISTPIVFGFLRMYSRINNLNTELNTRANMDSLTGLLNRHAFWEQVNKSHAGRAGVDDALLVIDIDHFKTVNDAHGHLIGDLALKMVAICLRGMVFERDIVGRLGGEEFCAVLYDCGPDGARLAAERIRASIEKNIIYSKAKPVYVTASIGGAVLGHFNSVEAAFEAADAAMFKAKQGGRNRFLMSDPDAQPISVAS
ncbi:MAG: GGDEF domain-containing protein [Phyllobacterium sp.]